MKRMNRLFTALGILAFLALCFVPSARGQAPTQLSYQAGVPFQLAGSYSFTASSTQTSAFNVGGLQYFELVWIPAGTVSTCTLTVDGAPIAGGTFTVGSLVGSQTCTASGSVITSSAAQAAQAKITPAITGSGTVTIFIFGFVNNPTSPVSQSGTWTVTTSGTTIVQPTAITTSGIAIVFSAQSALTTAVVVKASQGNLFGFSVTNGAASTCYLEFINASSAPSLGTNATFSVAIPANTTVTFPTSIYALNNFSSGISVGMATTYNGNTACGTAASATIFYK
jgi:hypothetical protein